MSFSKCLEQIAESARQKRLSLWVGAGISHDPPASLPLANELKLYILEKICDYPELRQLYEDRLRKGKDIGEDMKEYQLEAFIESISQSNPQIVTKIAELFLKGFPNKNHFLIARLIEKGIVREVLTTNLDLLIERALECITDDTSQRKLADYQVYSREEQFEQLQQELDHPSIFKIHGSADNEESMRITLKDVATKWLSQKRIPVLEHFLAANQGEVLVLGYGGGDDFDINPILSGIDSKKSIFFVDHKPGRRETAELPKMFQDLDGCSILCDTKEIVDYLWRAVLNEDWISLHNQCKKKVGPGDDPTTSWNGVIHEWAQQFSLQARLFVIAWILFRTRWRDESYSLFGQAKQICEKLGDQSGIASSLNNQGMIEQWRGNYPHATRLYNQSLKIVRKVWDQKRIAMTTSNLGIIEKEKGNYREARKLFNQAKVIFEKLGDRSELALCLNNVGAVEQALGHYDKASKWYQLSLETMQQFGYHGKLATTILKNLGDIAEKEDNEDEAIRLYKDGLQISQKLRYQSGIAEFLHMLGIVEDHRNNLDEAKRLYDQSLEIRLKLGERLGIAQTLHQLANIEYLKRNYPQARNLYEKSLSLNRELGNQSGVATTLYQLALVQYQERNYDEARRLCKENLTIEKKLGHQSRIADTLHSLGMIEHQRGNYGGARKLYNQSLRIRRKLGDQQGIALVLGLLGRLSEAQGDLVSAEKFYKRELRIFEKLREKPHIELARKDLERVQQLKKKKT